jgi:hypothetical protein
MILFWKDYYFRAYDYCSGIWYLWYLLLYPRLRRRWMSSSWSVIWVIHPSLFGDSLLIFYLKLYISVVVCNFFLENLYLGTMRFGWTIQCSGQSLWIPKICCYLAFINFLWFFVLYRTRSYRPWRNSVRWAKTTCISVNLSSGKVTANLIWKVRPYAFVCGLWEWKCVFFALR